VEGSNSSGRDVLTGYCRAVGAVVAAHTACISPEGCVGVDESATYALSIMVSFDRDWILVIADTGNSRLDSWRRYRPDMSSCTVLVKCKHPAGGASGAPLGFRNLTSYCCRHRGRSESRAGGELLSALKIADL
jgi:hypothetical protein